MNEHQCYLSVPNEGLRRVDADKSVAQKQKVPILSAQLHGCQIGRAPFIFTQIIPYYRSI